ncbi:hypothetical protein AAFF_G00052870 [Aldrovandia affinis]|uniref:G-protein coupled receptors family 1 profile domain-containing protein n=1 Tax=Aldrovandia affinis TaxID=143900 RepID=A0AAD7WZ01_9TELE|nr:hypothetical protein AAFF_G00052870 [Aldrovandia affinis]
MSESFTVTEDYYDFNTSNSYDIPEMCESSSAQELHIKVFQTCISIVVFLLGVLGNSLVIATFALYRRFRLRCMTDVFLLHLAKSDLLLLFTLPLQAADTLLGSWEFGTHLCKATRGLYAINTYSGLLLLACISIDRYVVIVQVQAAHRLRRRTLLYSKLAALGVWVISVLLSLPEIIFANVEVRDDGGGTVRDVRVDRGELAGQDRHPGGSDYRLLSALPDDAVLLQHDWSCSDAGAGLEAAAHSEADGGTVAGVPGLPASIHCGAFYKGSWPTGELCAMGCRPDG